MACASLTLVPLGCASVQIRQAPATADRPNFPRITAERLGGCVADYAQQLDGQHYRVVGNVQANDERRVLDVAITGLPVTAPDLAACARSVLRDMSVPTWPMRVRSEETVTKTNTSSLPPRDALGTPAIVVLGVTIVFTDLVIEAGGITIIFALSMDLANTIAKDLADVIRRTPADEDEEKNECLDGYVRCTESPAAGKDGNNWNEQRCATCFRVCRSEGAWPYHVPMSGRGMVLCY